MKRLFNFWIFVLILVLLIYPSFGAVGPKTMEMRCNSTGGTYEYSGRMFGECICPGNTNVFAGSCWVITPEEVCEGLRGRGGRIGEGIFDIRAVTGPQGSDFECKNNFKDITDLTWDKAVKYNENITSPIQLKENIKEELRKERGIPDLTYFIYGLGIILVIGLIIFFIKKKKS
ncbi:hypothetical protein JW949_04190 [Candidatus Woesearchaeota archaeon]|nr:hypothetical protein [Candidatus Woesearchaeota archaeon]